MHGHSRSSAHVVGVMALVAALAILVLAPSHHSLSTMGAAFFIVLAIKHLALLGAVGLPAAAAVRRWRPRACNRPGGAVALVPDADGWIRTGAAEPHRGVLRLEHDVRALPPSGALSAMGAQALVVLDADKRMTLRFLSDVEATQLRNGLRERYAKRGHRDAAAVERFLSPLTRPVARGEALIIAYDAATQSTRATLGQASAVEHGREFMQATWRLWFDPAAPAANSLALNLDPVSRPPGATLHSPRLYDLLAAVYCLGREQTMRGRTLDAARVGAGERVLDVCCGTGTLALAARHRVGTAGTVHAIDASTQMIAHARKRAVRDGLAVEFSLAAAQLLPFDDGSFDVVLCSLALHHLDDAARATAIAEMRRVVKPGGRVLALEFGRPRRLQLFLHPTALAHARRAAVVDHLVDEMRRAGLENLVSAPLGFASLTYALGVRPV